MRHRRLFRTLGRTHEERQNLFKKQIKSLLEHERICTTWGKARELRRVVEKLITKAAHKGDHPLLRERVKSFLNDSTLFTKLYVTLRERYEKRTGGYTRLYLKGARVSDKSKMAIIELVDSPFELKKALNMFKEQAITLQNSGKAFSIFTEQLAASKLNSIKKSEALSSKTSVSDDSYMLNKERRKEERLENRKALKDVIDDATFLARNPRIREHSLAIARENYKNHLHAKLQKFIYRDLSPKQIIGFSHPFQSNYLANLIKNLTISPSSTSTTSSASIRNTIRP